MAIQAFGYALDRWSSDRPTELSEVTLQASPGELRRIAAFLVEAAAEIDRDPHFDHLHLHEPTGPPAAGADIIVAK